MTRFYLFLGEQRIFLNSSGLPVFAVIGIELSGASVNRRFIKVGKVLSHVFCSLVFMAKQLTPDCSHHFLISDRWSKHARLERGEVLSEGSMS